MKAKVLLAAAFTLRKGCKYLGIVSEIVEGVINPKATYIQTFDRYTFCGVGCDPDVTFVTTTGATCYLFKVE